MRVSADTAAGIRLRFGQVVAVLLLQAALLFATAGTLRWAGAWMFLAVTVVFLVVNGTLLLRRSPETVAERGRPGPMAEWDRRVAGIWAIASYIVLPVVAGLDVRLGGGARLVWSWTVVGALLLLGALSFAGWAMAVNAFFSTAVRIQSERGHSVCQTGPYRLMRHPGYVGFIVQSIATPLTLGSVWALVPALLAVVSMIARTTLEDRLLVASLPGYQEYAARVRYRLVPGVW